MAAPLIGQGMAQNIPLPWNTVTCPMSAQVLAGSISKLLEGKGWPYFYKNLTRNHH